MKRIVSGVVVDDTNDYDKLIEELEMNKVQIARMKKIIEEYEKRFIVDDCK